MQKTLLKGKKNRLIQRNTFLLDELSFILAFFLAIAIRYDAIRAWKDYNNGIYISMIVTVLLFYVIVFSVYDIRRPVIVEMDPAENLIKLFKNRFLLYLLTIVYFYFTQKTVLTSRIVMTLFLIFSVVLGYVLRMVYRRYYIRKYGIPSGVRDYEIRLNDSVLQDPDYINGVIDKVKSGAFDCVLVIQGDASDQDTREILKKLESAGVRSYLSLDSMSYEVRSGIVQDIGSHAVIPAFVRSDRAEIFGVSYCIARTEEAVHHVLEHLEEFKGRYICFSNVHTTVMAKENPQYAAILNEAACVFPDGTPIAKLQSKQGHESAERVAGPDFMANMFRDTMDGRVSHYFYGSKPETLEMLKAELTRKYPGINIKGMYSPPFRALDPKEDEDVIRRINESGADIVWIGLGAPKQEQWMNAHKGRINGVMMGVGAGFDFHAGTIQRAPVWLQKIGLEWLYRLIRDPGRLLNRYLVTNNKFFWYLLKEKLSDRKHND